MEQLFSSIFNSAYLMKKNKKTVDGKHAWEKIKQIIAPFADIALPNGFKQIPQDIFKLIMEMPEKTIDGYGNQKMIEINHFLIQMVRIPTKEDPILQKLVQIAFNLGQYNGMLHHILPNGHYPAITDGNIRFITDGLTHLTDYITNEDIAEIDKILLSRDVIIDVICYKIQAELTMLSIS